MSGSAMANHLRSLRLPAGTASLMINHAFPGDKLDDLQKLAPTTKQFRKRRKRWQLGPKRC